MAIEMVKECDVGRGFNFVATEHARVGYIDGLVFGNAAVAGDLAVPKEATIVGTSAPTGSRRVVAVLGVVTWPTTPTAPIVFSGRVSPANAQLIQAYAQGAGAVTAVAIAWSVYEYDSVASLYYPSFNSFKGSTPPGKPGQPLVVESSARTIYGCVRRTNGVLGLTISPAPLTDVAGIPTHEFTLTLAPVAASSPQQVKVQTSSSNKQNKPFGLPLA